MKIQIFETIDSVELQDQINDWIEMYEEDVNIQEVKVSYSQGCYLGTIVYEED